MAIRSPSLFRSTDRRRRIARARTPASSATSRLAAASPVSPFSTRRLWKSHPAPPTRLPPARAAASPPPLSRPPAGETPPPPPPPPAPQKNGGPPAPFFRRQP